MQFNLNSKRFYGALCSAHHDHGGQRSLRYLSDGGCVECRRLKSASWASANAARMRELQSDWFNGHRAEHAKWKRGWRSDVFKRTLGVSRARARKHLLPFDLSEQYLIDLWEKQEGRCYWIKIPLDPGATNRALRSPSLDRLIPSLGYTEGNVVWSCWFANGGRNENSVDDFREFLNEVGIDH